MPCLNERESLEFCIGEATSFLEKSGITGEILIADNNSSDGSQKLARSLGARVINIEKRGYGNAIIGGIKAANGKYIILGDCDGSYDFLNLEPFVKKLRDGYSLVVGNRFLGGIEKGAMSLSHKIGVPFLSWCARIKFKAPVGDFHCGLRGFDREKALALGLGCTGMEFSTEIIAKFSLAHESICEVSAQLRKDRRSGKSHLRTLPDGLRHLKFILAHK